MSVICCSDVGWVVSHSEYIKKLYKSINLESKEEMFAVNTPYMTDAQALKRSNSRETLNQLLSSPCEEAVVPKKKRRKKSLINEVPAEYESHINEVTRIQEVFPSLVTEAKRHGYFHFAASSEVFKKNNSSCRNFAARVFEESTLGGEGNTFNGGNASSAATIATVQGHKYVLPPSCAFYCRDVAGLKREALGDSCPADGFDFVVIDPPWWNKYIRRRKASNKQSGYSMLRTEDLVQIDLKSLLAPGALVAVWCTNSQSHVDAIHESLFPTWGLSHVATWFWLKVDRSGTPVCNFSVPPGKQPYERIIFGRPQVKEATKASTNPQDGKIVVSIPSAIHSHKPPLLELLSAHLPSAPCSLEVFARSLLPGAVSWGLEVLKLQHEALFTAPSRPTG